jgi:hypothetical protein
VPASASSQSISLFDCSSVASSPSSSVVEQPGSITSATLASSSAARDFLRNSNMSIFPFPLYKLFLFVCVFNTNQSVTFNIDVNQ